MDASFHKFVKVTTILNNIENTPCNTINDIALKHGKTPKKNFKHNFINWVQRFLWETLEDRVEKYDNIDVLMEKYLK